MRRFRGGLHGLGQEVFLPDDHSEDEWKALTALYLHDAGFSVDEIEKWMTIGVLVAKAEVAQTLRRYQEQTHGRINGANTGST